MNWQIKGWVLAGAVVVLAVFLGSAIIAYMNTEALVGDQEWVAHSLEVLADLETVSARMSESESAARGFLITGDRRYLEPYNETAHSLPRNLQELSKLVRDNPVQQENLAELRDSISRKLAEIEAGIQTEQRYGLEAARQQMFSSGNTDAGEIEAIVNRMVAQENALLVARTERSRETARRTLVVAVLSSTIGILLVGLFAFMTIRSVRDRLSAAQQLSESEEHLKLALHLANAWSWQYDLRTGAMNRSQDISRFLGLPPGSVSDHLESSLVRYHPQDAERFRRELARSIENGNEFDDELRVVWPDGGVHWFAVRGRAVYDQHQQPLHVVGIDIEITDRKRQEEVMREAEKLASAGRLAATLAHEINNPLEAVNSIHYLLLRHGKLDAETRQHLEIANQEMARAIEVIRNTLGLYRDASVPLAVELAQVVDHVLSLFDRSLRQKHIEVRRHYETEGRVYGYRGEIRQIFINLIGNAIDAMGEGGALTIHLADSLDWRNGGHPGVRATIADTGCGITPEIRRRLFQPFFSTKGEKGTGLGLWVTQQLVEKHGGKIRLWSRSKGQRPSGTWFSVFLPDAEETAFRIRR